MCFSSQASFAGAIVLGTVGVFCLKNLSRPNQLLLAMIPFIFALQQLIEGFLWVTTENLESFLSHIEALKNSFLFIAFFVWPVYVPLSLLMAESNGSKNYWLTGCLAVGIFFVLFILYGLMNWWGLNDVTMNIQEHSIQYSLPALTEPLATFLTALYFIATLLSQFFSKLKGMPYLAFANVIGFLAAYYFYNITFISVWCFFAAWVCLGIYVVIKLNRNGSSLA